MRSGHAGYLYREFSATHFLTPAAVLLYEGVFDANDKELAEDFALEAAPLMAHAQAHNRQGYSAAGNRQDCRKSRYGMYVACLGLMYGETLWQTIFQQWLPSR